MRLSRKRGMSGAFQRSMVKITEDKAVAATTGRSRKSRLKCGCTEFRTIQPLFDFSDLPSHLIAFCLVFSLLVLVGDCFQSRKIPGLSQRPDIPVCSASSPGVHIQWRLLLQSPPTGHGAVNFLSLPALLPASVSVLETPPEQEYLAAVLQSLDHEEWRLQRSPAGHLDRAARENCR